MSQIRNTGFWTYCGWPASHFSIHYILFLKSLLLWDWSRKPALAVLSLVRFYVIYCINDFRIQSLVFFLIPFLIYVFSLLIFAFFFSNFNNKCALEQTFSNILQKIQDLFPTSGILRLIPISTLKVPYVGVADLWHLGTDLDPGIRTSDWWFWIRILLFSSVTFKTWQLQIFFFPKIFCSVLFQNTFTSFFKDTKL